MMRRGLVHDGRRFTRDRCTSGDDLFDANVLVYASIDTAAGLRHASARRFDRAAAVAAGAVLILQTMTEFYSVATSKFRRPSRDALLFLDKLRAVLSVHAADERDFDRRPGRPRTVCRSGTPCCGPQLIGSGCAIC